MPLSLTMIGHELTWEADRTLAEIAELREIGVTGMAIMLPAESRSEFKDQLVRFSEDMLQKLPA